jgi:hypothetical protein
MAARLRRQSPDVTASLTSIWTWILVSLQSGDTTGVDYTTGEPGAVDPLTEILLGTGTAAATTERFGEAGPLIVDEASQRADAAKALATCNWEDVKRVALVADLDSLAWGRDALYTLIEFAKAYAPALTRSSNSVDAMGFSGVADLTLDDTDICVLAPAMLLIRSQFPEMEQGLIELQNRTALFAAVSQLLDDLPARFHHYLGPEGLQLQATMHDSEKRELQAALDIFTRQHPEAMHLIEASTT